MFSSSFWKDPSHDFTNYQEKIQKIKADYDEKIEKFCSSQYGNFIVCMEELIEVRPAAMSLGENIFEINEKIYKSNEILQRKADELIRVRRILVNSSTSSETLSRCIFVLEQYCKFNSELTDRKYFLALKTLESLENDYLPNLIAHKFVQSMLDTIPNYRAAIKDATLRDVNEFLETIIMEGQKLGEVALESFVRQQKVNLQYLYRNTIDFESLAIEIPTTNLSSINFRAIYQGLHIFTKLGIREEFKLYYRKQRLEQAKLAFRPPNSLSQSARSYVDYFNSVVGFYLIEDHLMGTTDDLIDTEYLNIWFEHAKAEAEFQIYRKINEKIDEIFSIANYDWTSAEASGQASSFISDLIAWLRTSFDSLGYLPPSIAQGACISACKHLAKSLRDMLLSDDNKSLSLGGLEQFNLDLMQCEVFAGSEPVKGFKDGDLQTVFAELRQICDLFLYEDYSTYIADMGKQQNKYLRVTTATALAMCEKLREYDRSKNFMALKKNDKQRKRDLFVKILGQQSVQIKQ